MKKIIFVVNDDWFFKSHRLPIALRAKQLGYDVHIATGQYEGYSIFKEYGFKHHTFRIARGKVSPISDLFMLVDLCRLYFKVKPDIVHHVTIKPVIYGGIASRIANVKGIVQAISGLGVIFIGEGIRDQIKKYLVSKLYKVALGGKNSVIICQNTDDKATLESLVGLPKLNFKIIKGSGVDLVALKYVPYKTRGNKRVVLLSRMLKDKGVLEFYEAAKLLKPSFSSTKFILAGGTHDNPSSLDEKKLESWNKEGVIEWIGHVDNPNSVIEDADIVVLPSYREGLPKVLLEAGAIGRAVVTTDVPGCRDAVIDGRTALVVKSKSIDELSEAIRTLLLDHELCVCMGLNGRQLVEKEFSIEHVVLKHFEIYDSFGNRSI
ncbi:glycosyltransferase family 4 protein [Vibrio sp. S12_S33]|uniref:glycosyltransferase family 4 protein n=1 Tax=Vibrio sp. S12_S33 TaxID=2720223 RepID=UPI0017862C49|nr:glycosyltransferase family 4 protein [Vibrio sp. S12_S33]MBD1564534.1 glycosyltransferase family 4 protein [Vibrio sp. S12_S33]